MGGGISKKGSCWRRSSSSSSGCSQCADKLESAASSPPPTHASPPPPTHASPPPSPPHFSPPPYTPPPHFPPSPYAQPSHFPPPPYAQPSHFPPPPYAPSSYFPRPPYAPPSYFPRPPYAPPLYFPRPPYPPQPVYPSWEDYGGSMEFGGHDRSYSKLADSNSTLEEVSKALARAGLGSCNLIFGIDFTKSNEWTGKRSFGGRSLHHIGDDPNPYQQAISIIGKTLAAFDEDNLIFCFGFGDASTQDQDVFSFYADERSCNRFNEVLNRYKEVVPHLRLAGPTSFAPIIEMAMTVVEQNSGKFHILVIVADGEVTRSVDTPRGQLSPQEQNTLKAMFEASNFPLSIIFVGVGDESWVRMNDFDRRMPAGLVFHKLVNFTEIMSKTSDSVQKETQFAIAALEQLPYQYAETIKLFGFVSGRKGSAPQRVPLPPPVYGASSFSSTEPSRSSFQHSASPSNESDTTAPSAPSTSLDDQFCPICLSNSKDMAFGCGHQTCCECGQNLPQCPICRRSIQTRIKLY